MIGRRTKIVATLGPASSSPEVIGALIDAGVDVVRLGFAHGSVEEHLARIALVRRLAEERRRVVGVLADLPGPKVRTGPFTDRTPLQEHAVVTVVPGDGASSASVINVDYDGVLDDITEGDPVSLGDGAVILQIERVDDTAARAVVLHGGALLGRPGFHFPAGRLQLSTPTPEDLAHLQICLDAGVDIVAVSFVKRGDDLRKVRAAAGADGPLLMAKIETAVAVSNLDEILEEADAVMVARGDLGTECAIEDVPHLQKRIVRACVTTARPVVTATQMLESMTTTTTPTRAEASDVANAVLDGTDALMLSGETAVGVDPPNVVRTMARIARRAEQETDWTRWGREMADRQVLGGITGAMAHAAWRAATDAGASAVICCTRAGATARAMATLRPTAKLLSLSNDSRVLARLTVSWGAVPLLLPSYTTTEEMVAGAVDTVIAAGEVSTGDIVAVVAASPDSPDRTTDLLRLVRIP